MSNGSVAVIMTEDNSTTGKWLNVIRTAFNAPFDLSRYHICLKNDTTGKDKTHLNIKAVIINEAGNVVLGPIEIGPRGKRCGIVSFKPLFLRIYDEGLYETDTQFDVAVSEEEGVLPTKESKIVSTFIFLLAYGVTVRLTKDYIIWVKRSFMCKK